MRGWRTTRYQIYRDVQAAENLALLMGERRRGHATTLQFSDWRIVDWLLPANFEILCENFTDGTGACGLDDERVEALLLCGTILIVSFG